MPNWCYNFLTIQAPSAELLQEFWSKAEKDGEETFSLKHWFPIPEDQENDWYNWCCENWGTKWDVDGADITHDSDESITINFNTAWASPKAFFRKISKDFPELNFIISFDEPGCDSFGFYEIQDGDIVDSEEYRSESAEYLLRDKDPRTYCFARRVMKERLSDTYTTAWVACEDGCDHCEAERESDTESENEEEETSSDTE
jgi:hypothetical protein